MTAFLVGAVAFAVVATPVLITLWVFWECEHGKDGN